MRGQWMGTYQGSNSGQIIVDIDEIDTAYSGVAYLNEQNTLLPRTAATFETLNKTNNQSFTAYVHPVNPHTLMIDNWENVRKFYGQNVIIPSQAQVQIKETSRTLSLHWTTNIGSTGSAKLPKSKASRPSKVPVQVMTWTQFKSETANFLGSNRSFLFRGQSDVWRLRTAFHRRGRANLYRFINQDVPILHRHLSSRTKHYFNLQIPEQNGAFLNLAQHHGYPTPLLDWSYSPYVAAFFAFREVSNKEAIKSKNNDYVRIYIFNQALWRSKVNQVQQLITSASHFSIHEFSSIDNERMIPQQAASSVTNIDDIESYILQYQQNGDQFLRAVDIHKSERKKVMNELQYMGITAGALFPGIDGACEELREQLFKF